MPLDVDSVFSRFDFRHRLLVVLVLTLGASGCSVRKFALNQVGSAMASGGSTFTSDDDIELVQQALPFALKLTEGALAEVPRNRDWLYLAAMGFTSYAYIGPQQQLDRVKDSDLEEASRYRARVRRLYLRAHEYGLRGLEASHKGFSANLASTPRSAVTILNKKDVPLIYWTAASLGLAISSSRDDVSLIARIPEVDAMVDRALDLDETWQDGAFHTFAIVLAAAKPGSVDYQKVSQHYQRALELSRGKDAGLHLTYAESVSVPNQRRDEFEDLLTRALAVDPNEAQDTRLLNVLAQERARWLLERIDDLILSAEKELVTGKENQ
jgi:predicted anti-sigma-YlaC factor YlaD